MDTEILEKRMSNQVNIIDDLKDDLKEMTALANHLQEKSARTIKEIEIKVDDNTFNIREMEDGYDNLWQKHIKLIKDLGNLHHSMEIDDREDSQRKLQRIIDKVS